MARAPELFIVGLNIKKGPASAAAQRGDLVRFSHGVYLPAGADPIRAFRVYGLRIAHVKMPYAALTHSSAWFRAPIDVWSTAEKPILKSIDIYIGSRHATPVATLGEGLRCEGQPTLRIVQSNVGTNMRPTEGLPPGLYEKGVFRDPLGTFEMYTPTPEVLVLQLREATKRHQGKLRIGEDGWNAVYALLLKRHGNDPFEVAKAVETAHANIEKLRSPKFQDADHVPPPAAVASITRFFQEDLPKLAYLARQGPTRTRR